MLVALAAQRGMRGYSEIVREALDQYIEIQARQASMKEEVLAMKGTWETEETEQTKSRLLELRERWKIS
jgi:metal-responsive CopG/Arc/MetJ family transcriptional regulator